MAFMLDLTVLLSGEITCYQGNQSFLYRARRLSAAEMLRGRPQTDTSSAFRPKPRAASRNKKPLARVTTKSWPKTETVHEKSLAPRVSTWFEVAFAFRVRVKPTLGSLSNHVYERRTSTGSGLFSFLEYGVHQTFSQIVSVRVKKLSNTNFISSRHIKREKSSLPVDVRRSKTSLLKLP